VKQNKIASHKQSMMFLARGWLVGCDFCCCWYWQINNNNNNTKFI